MFSAPKLFPYVGLRAGKESIVKTIETSVEVACDQAGWNFPKDHPTRTNKDGKTYYTIPVTYVLLESADVTLSDPSAKALADAGVTDVVKEMNAGIKLAIGDVVKKQYRANKGGKAEQVTAATAWLLKSGDQSLVQTFIGLPPAQQQKWLLEQYEAREQ
jgi:hypothetical protein